MLTSNFEGRYKCTMIKVTERFYINADMNCYKLQEKTTVQDETSKNFGKEIFKDVGYFITIEQCIEAILKVQSREYVSRSEENTIKDLKNFIAEQVKEIKSSLDGVI